MSIVAGYLVLIAFCVFLVPVLFVVTTAATIANG